MFAGTDKIEKLPVELQDLYREIDFSVLSKYFVPPKTLANISKVASTEYRVERFMYNVLSFLINESNDNLDGYVKHVKEAYSFIKNNPEVRVIDLPIGVANMYGERRAVSVRSGHALDVYSLPTKRVILYSFNLSSNNKIIYRYIPELEGITLEYEHI